MITCLWCLWSMLMLNRTIKSVPYAYLCRECIVSNNIVGLSDYVYHGTCCQCNNDRWLTRARKIMQKIDNL